ncbi:MAG: ABC transporter ATP-binding protein [Lachnospiraceae bacterium]|nr:ABC transporter ATP-binding protein [Lachnospiraceae bacterium]MEE1015190.1 ABC transporter ATP-binding protein [Lachnospiraceae bacterium]
MKRLLVFLKDYKKETVLAPLFKLLEASFELMIPLVVAAIVDQGIGQGNLNYVYKAGGIMILLGIIGLIAAVSAQFFAAKAAVGFATGLRSALFQHIQSLSYTEIDQVGTSTLITRLTSDVNQVQSGVNMTLRLLLRSPFIVFGAMIMAFTVDVKAALVFVGVIPLLCIVVFGIMVLTMPMYKLVQKRLDEVLALTRENLTGIRVIRAFHKEKEEIEKFKKSNEELTEIQLGVGKVSALMNPVTYVIINLGLVLLIYFGAIQVDAGHLTQGQVIALINYISQILVELIKMANLIVLITKALSSANRLSNIFDISSSMTENGDASIQEEKEIPILEFENVGFCYAGAGEDSLSNIDFSVYKGETVGIIGGTGSGKSTLVNLIPRFYDATSGQVLYHGKSIGEYNLEELRGRIGVVPQKAVLFKGTIKSNLQWGNEKASDEELEEALKVSQAKEFVEKLDKYLDAPVAQGGKNFSGGQRQRLTIARAMVRKPEILILDDSTSALDYATDARLRAELKARKESMTTFIVSQRTSSIQFADKIIVLEDGKIVGLGTHKYLLEHCEVYQEIYDSQYQNPEEEEGADE